MSNHNKNRQDLSRREFLSIAALTAAGVAIAACQPKTVVVKETVVVEKEKEVTKIVEKEVTKIVEKEVTPTPLPSGFKEAPMLAELVEKGELPPVEERLPVNPDVIKPWEEIGEYGGTWQEVNRRDDTAYVALQHYEPMLRIGMYDFKPIPNVAESWERDSEGKVFTFHLRKGLRWSDGTPFTADDVEFWFDDITNNKELSPAFAFWLTAGGESCRVEKVDDYTVWFIFDNPAALFLTYVAGPWHESFRPKHYLQQFHASYVDKSKAESKAKAEGFDTWMSYFQDRNDYNHNQDLPVVFPWVRAESETGIGNYTRNAYYWKVDTEGNQLPYIDKVQVQKVASTEIAQMKVFGGEVDLIPFAAGEGPADTMVLKKNEEMGNYHVLLAPIAEPNVHLTGLNLNHKDPVLREIFGDRRFRIALSHAIKRQDMLSLLYLDQPKEIRQVAPLSYSPYYDEKAAHDHVEYDLDKANELLDEVGLSERGADGYRLRPDGKPVEIVVQAMSFLKHMVDSAEMIAGYWKEVGIKAMAKAIDVSLFFERVEAAEHDAGITWCGGGFDPVSKPAWQIPINKRESLWAPLWALWYESRGESGEEPPDEVKRQFEIYDEVLRTVDDDKKVELWQEVNEINAENRFAFGICDRAPVPLPISNRLHNVPDEGFDMNWNLGNMGSTNPSSYFNRE